MREKLAWAFVDWGVLFARAMHHCLVSSVVDILVWKHARVKVADPAEDWGFPSLASRAIGIHEGAYVS